jgi:hypothetical protein
MKAVGMTIPSSLMATMVKRSRNADLRRRRHRLMVEMMMMMEEEEVEEEEEEKAEDSVIAILWESPKRRRLRKLLYLSFPRLRIIWRGK